MTMKELEKTLLIVGSAVLVVGTLLHLVAGVAQKYLSISAGPGGTTDPSPGRYLKSAGENVTIRALPSEGYTVGSWVVDGVEVTRGVDAFTVTMDANHDVIVTFWEGGVPPPTYPVGLTFPSSPQYFGQNYKAGIEYVWELPACPFGCQHLVCDPQKNAGEIGYGTLIIPGFVFDAAGKGVPKVDVAVWSSETPDGYHGTLILNGAVRTRENPLIVKSDEDGSFTVSAQYLTDMDWLCQQTCRMHPVETAAKPCDKAPLPYLWISCVEHETPYVPYTIYGQAVGTTVMGQGQILVKATLR
jgi:hypothetical protein